MAVDTARMTSSLVMGRWDQDGNPIDRDGRIVRGPKVIHLHSPDHEDHIRQARAWGLQLIIGRMDVYKYDGDFSEDQVARGELPEPYEIVRGFNLLMDGGASCLWEFLKGNGNTTPGDVLCYFNNTNAAIGAGDSNTAAVATQTDLQAASGTTHQLRKGMVATYPTHTDGVIAGSAVIVFQSSFGSSEGNFAWAEWGIFNSPTAATGRMLDRVVQSNGTKASGATWVPTATLTLG